MPNYITVQPDLISWAIERSGLSEADYPKHVQDWLARKKRPTYKQLEAFARRAMVPFAYLFLQGPPDESLPIPDYRTRSEETVRRPSPNLIDTIFAMQSRQAWMREYLIDEGHDALPFVASAKVGGKIPPLAARIREALQLDDDWAEKHSSWENALRFLRKQVENAGILIFINGIVGNNTHRKLDPEEFQGFVLVDTMAPLVFINGSDLKVAQMFTLAHELAHIWVGENGLFEFAATRSAAIEVERYCNEVAAEFLVPADKLKKAWAHVSNDSYTALVKLAVPFKVSPIVVARRAKDLRMISAGTFIAFYHRYTNRERRKQDDKENGGDFWKNQTQRVGRRFAQAVVAAAEQGHLSFTDAYQLTSLYGDTFDKYARYLSQEAAE